MLLSSHQQQLLRRGANLYCFPATLSKWHPTQTTRSRPSRPHRRACVLRPPLRVGNVLVGTDFFWCLWDCVLQRDWFLWCLVRLRLCCNALVVTDFFDVCGTAFCNALVVTDFFWCLWDCVLQRDWFLWCLWDCVSVATLLSWLISLMSVGLRFATLLSWLFFCFLFFMSMGLCCNAVVRTDVCGTAFCNVGCHDWFLFMGLCVATWLISLMSVGLRFATLLSGQICFDVSGTVLQHSCQDRFLWCLWYCVATLLSWLISFGVCGTAWCNVTDFFQSLKETVTERNQSRETARCNALVVTDSFGVCGTVTWRHTLVVTDLSDVPGTVLQYPCCGWFLWCLWDCVAIPLLWLVSLMSMGLCCNTLAVADFSDVYGTVLQCFCCRDWLLWCLWDWVLQ